MTTSVTKDERTCLCSDPENCTERVPGYRCKKDSMPNVVPIHPNADARALAAALEALTNWMYARDMGAHIKIGVPPRSGFCPEYVNDINTIRRAVAIARKLGFAFKALEIP